MLLLLLLRSWWSGFTWRLPVGNFKQNYWSDFCENFTRDIPADEEELVKCWKPSACGFDSRKSSACGFESRNFLKISQHCEIRDYSTAWLIYLWKKTCLIFMKILSEMYLWKKTSPLNFGSFVPDRLDSPWRRSELSESSCFHTAVITLPSFY